MGFNYPKTTCENCREQQEAGDGDPDCETGECIRGLDKLSSDDAEIINLWYHLRGGSDLLTPEIVIAMHGGVRIEDLKTVIAMNNEQNRLDKLKADKERG